MLLDTPRIGPRVVSHRRTVPGFRRLLHIGRVWRNSLWLICLLLCLTLTRLATAIIVYSTGDPAHNTTAPTGSLTNSGWQYQGTWGAFLGTPIASNYFIAAAHVGGCVGDVFHFRGVDYPTTAMFSDTNSDLRLWRICGSFPDFASLYPLSNEVGKTVVVFGRGTQRGEDVMVTNLVLSVLKGWKWGPTDSVERWGTNVVTSIVDGGSLGTFLKCNFDASGGDDEADLSTGDSSGGVFIKEGAVWKLAAINYAVDGPFNTSTNGPGFFGAIFDEGGLYRPQGTNWVLIPDLPTDLPSAFYSTRISAHLDWINATLQSALPRLLAASSVGGPYVDLPGAVVDQVAETITIPRPANTQFYRLQGCESSSITNIAISGAMLVISFQ